MPDEFNSTNQNLQHADALLKKGMKLFRKSYFSDYYDLFEKAANIYFDCEKWEKYFECKMGMIIWLYYKNRLKAAESLGEQLLELYHRAMKETSLLEYKLHSHMAKVFSAQNKLEKTREYHQKSLLIAQKLQRYDAIGNSYIGLGSVSFNMYNYYEALYYYYKALEIEKQQGYNNSSNYIFTHLNIAITYFKIHQNDLAKNYLQKSLYLFNKNKDHFHISVIKKLLGEIADRQGFYLQAATYYKGALEIMQKYNIKNIDYPNLLFSMGLLYAKQKDWAKGKEKFQEAIAVHNTFEIKDYSWFLDTYLQLTMLYLSDKQWNMAIHYLEEAQKANQQLPLTKNYGKANIHFHFGLLFEKQSKLEEALQYTQKAVKYWNKGFRLHKIKEKQLLFQIRSLQISIYRQLFVCHKENRYLLTANQLISSIYLLMEEINGGVFQEKDQIDFRQQAGKMYKNTLYLLYEYYLLTSEEETLEEIFVLFEKSKVNSLLSSFKNAEALQLTGIPNEKLQELQLLQSRIVIVEKRLKSTLKNNTDELQNEIAEEFVELQIDYHQFIRKLEEEYPNYLYTKNQIPSIDIEELQELLKPQTALVEYEITQDYLYIFCLTATNSEIKRIERKFSIVH